MADTTAPSASRRSRVPQWLYEGVDLVQQRRRALLITFGVVAVTAGAVSYLVPDVLPPEPIVGAAVGVAGLLLALAVLIALDTASIKVRGPRHIRAAGGELVAVLPSEPSRDGAADLARAIEEVRPPGRTLLLGIAAATGDGKRVGRWAQVVARSLAERDTSVLSLDLTAESSDRPGFLEVVRSGTKLSEVVELDPEVRLATLGPGRDTTEALRAFNEAGRWIPRDLEVLLVALPMAASRAVVRASLSLDQLLIVAERDRTSRVELIAGLDATEAVGTHSQVILIDDTYASYLGIGADGAGPAEEPQDDEVEPDPDLEARLGQATDHAEDRVAADDVPPETMPIAEPEPYIAEVVAEPAADEPQDSEEPQEHGEPTGGEPEEPDEQDGPGVGARDVDVMMGAAAATALADIQANADIGEADGDTEDRKHPAGATEDSADPEDGDDELTVRVHPPDPIDEDEPTLEVERPADVGPVADDPAGNDGPVDDHPAAEAPELIEVGEVKASPEVEVDDVDAEDDEDLLNTTARLSLLMDEVSDRDSNGGEGGT